MVRFFLFIFFAVTRLHAIEPLTINDIHEKMDKIFKEHLTQKKMTPQMMRQVITQFIDQFDQFHVYLLSSDVAPFLSMNQRQLQAVVEQYQRGDYTLFTKMIKVFQEAIKRMRAFRSSLHVDKELFYRLNLTPFPSVRDLKGAFCAAEAELQKRGAVYIARLATVQEKQQKNTKSRSLEEAIRTIERNLEEDENKYLYLDSRGRSLSPKESETLFSFHILQALTASLDAHSSFLDEKEAEKLRENLEKGRVDTSFETTEKGIIGIVALHSFYQGDGELSSEHDLQKALELLSKKGKICGLVLDLRDNRGGFLAQAVKVVGLFIKSGVVVVAKYGDNSLRYFRDTDSDVKYQGPLVVLVSRQTASAAEIVTQALQDYGVAVVVGDDHTYGKASIQAQTATTVKESEPSFKVTVGRYYGVSGRSPQIQGVKSDVIIPAGAFESKIGEAYLTGTISQESISPSFKDSLSDVPIGEKAWYEEHYLPFLQQKTDKYRKWIPALEKRSQERLARNSDYQQILYNSAGGDRARKMLRDVQLQEAVSIAKDLSNFPINN